MSSGEMSPQRSEVGGLSVGHLADLLHQVLGTDVGQTLVQWTTLHQTVHWSGRDHRLLLLIALTTVSILLFQEVLHKGEELLTGR